MSSKKTRVNVLALLVILLGCGAFGRGPMAPAFDIRLTPNNKEKVTAIGGAVKQHSTQLSGKSSLVSSNSLGKPVMLATKTGQPTTLSLYLLDEGKELWSRDVKTTTRPSLLYDTVIVKEEMELVGLKIENGSERWRFNPEGWDFFGAAQQNDSIFMTLGIGGECRKAGLHRSRVLAMNAKTGMVMWERSTEGHCLGAPAVYGNYVFLPFDMQSISILTADGGVEEARLLSLDDNFTFVASFPEGVFYGSKGLYSFDKRSSSGLKKSVYELQIKTNDPVQLSLTTDENDTITLYRSKGGAPPGYEDKATPLGRWEMGQDRFLTMNTDGTFTVTNKRNDITTLQKKGTLFVGGEGKFSVVEGKKLVFNAFASTYFRPPLAKIPGEPELFKDRISPVIGITNARDKIRLFWLPESVQEGGTINLMGDSIILLYYRFIFSFNAATGELRWAHRSSLDIEDMALGAAGIFIADRKGDVICLDMATGLMKGKIETGKMLTAASLHVGKFSPSAVKGKEAPETLRESLLEMILDKDNRLVPIRQFALGFLAKIEDPEVTRDLLTVYMNKAVPVEIKTIARQKILERESGASFIIDAMQFHYDYLNEISPPPVGVVAQALVKMKAKEGVLPLLQHLLDHETTLEDLREVAQALLELGDESIVPAVSDYLVRYHADSAFTKDLNTLFVLAEVIHKYGGVEGEELLRSLQAEKKTTKALANHIKEIFDAAYQAELTAKMEKEAGEKVEEKAEEEVDSGKVYQTLTQGQVMKIMDGHKAEFSPCIQEYVDKVPTTTQVRLKFILNNKGKIENLLTLPNDPGLSSCLMGALLKVKWPKIKQLKQTAQYVIKVAAPKKVETPEWPPQPTPVPEEGKPEKTPKPEKKPDEWMPQPQPIPLPQPELPQPGPEPTPETPPDKPPGPGVEDYPDVLPEDLPEG